MGIDLVLLPFDSDGDNPVVSYSHTVLTCTLSHELAEELKKIPAPQVPKNFRSYLGTDEEYDGPRYGATQETPYGEPLKYVRVGQLNPFRFHEIVRADPNKKAIWAFLNELPGNTKVALYWK